MTKPHEQLDGQGIESGAPRIRAVASNAEEVLEAATRAPEKRKRLPRRFSKLELMGEPGSPDSVNVITMAGDTFTGKTGTAQKIVGGGRFPAEDFFLVGERIRAVENSGQGPQNRVKRERAVDIKFDEEQQEMIGSGRQKFIESRLASILVSRMRAAEPEREINAVSVLLTASEAVRRKRAFRRALVNQEKGIAKLEKTIAANSDAADKEKLIAEKSALESIHYTEDGVWAVEESRTREDEDFYRGLYPWFNQEIPGNFLDPDLEINGQRVYDIVIPTDGYTEQEVYRLTCRAIILFRKYRDTISSIVGVRAVRMDNGLWVRRGAHGQLWTFGKAPSDQPR
jgi:cytidylate kinase